MLTFLIAFFLSRVSSLSCSADCHKIGFFSCVSGLPTCRQKWVLFQNSCIQQLPQILCGLLGYWSFGGDFLVLLKGVAKFLHDVTGEETVSYSQFSRTFCFHWFIAKVLWEQIQVSWSDLTILQENGCHSWQHGQKKQWNGMASCRALLFSGWDAPVQDSMHL